MTHDNTLYTEQTSAGPSKRQKIKKQEAASQHDPLTCEQALSLLNGVAVIRDPLHGDIRITALERTLIDTAAFQRLRQIRQLPMVDLVYPGAVHNRFMHSLGVLHVCSEMVSACNNSADMLRPLAAPQHPLPVRISCYAELLARLVALLHDMAHIPYGHVFEHDAGVIRNDEWKDPWRVERVFGDDSEITNTVRAFFVKHFSERGAEATSLATHAAEDAATRLVRDVRDVLVADQTQALDLPYPFVFDLVGHTICADLIDYVQRDMYFAGLTEGLGTRFVHHLAVLPVEYGSDTVFRARRVAENREYAEPRREERDLVQACRLVLVLYRYNERYAATSKHNVLAEVIDLVRRRKLVAEKLYLHKTKLVATSMLAEATYSMGIGSAEALWAKSDHEVLTILAQADQQIRTETSATDRRRLLRAARLGRSLLARHLFKPIYRLSCIQEDDTATSIVLWDQPNGAYARFCTPSGREGLVQTLEDIISAKHGDPDAGVGAVAVSCPDRRMQLKAFDMLVLTRPDEAEVQPLQQTVRPTIRQEIDVIQKGHRELWRLEVFVDPAVVDLNSDLAAQLAGAAAYEIGLQNEVQEYRNAPTVAPGDVLAQLTLDSVLRECGLAAGITHDHYTQLCAMAPQRKSIEQHLRQWGYLTDDRRA